VVVNREYVKRLAEDIERSVDAVVRLVEKPFDELSEAEKLAIRYYLIVVAEALAAMALHLARRVFGERPETPIHAFRILRDRGLLSDEELRDVTSLLRLRNLLVHRYWAVDDSRIYKLVKSDFEKVMSVVGKLLNYVGGGGN